MMRLTVFLLIWSAFATLEQPAMADASMAFLVTPANKISSLAIRDAEGWWVQPFSKDKTISLYKSVFANFEKTGDIALKDLVPISANGYQPREQKESTELYLNESFFPVLKFTETHAYVAIDVRKPVFAWISRDFGSFVDLNKLDKTDPGLLECMNPLTLGTLKDQRIFPSPTSGGPSKRLERSKESGDDPLLIFLGREGDFVKVAHFKHWLERDKKFDPNQHVAGWMPLYNKKRELTFWPMCPSGC